MKISSRLLLLFVLVAVLPLGLFSYLNLQQDEATLRNEAQVRLAGLADKKALEISNYLSERVSDVHLLARMEQTRQAMAALSQAYQQYRPGTAEYAAVDATFRVFFANYMDEGLVQDVFLITPQGEIIYSQKHRADFATNLLSGTFRDTQFATAFREASMTFEPTFSRYEIFAPSSNARVAFIVAPVLVEGKYKGMFAVQLNDDRLIRVASDTTGLGLTGETVLAEPDGKGGARFVAPLKSDPGASIKRKVDAQALLGTPILSALGGEQNEGLELDYRGAPVVAAWRYLPALNWGMVVKIDADEIFAAIYHERLIMLEALVGMLLFTALISYYLGRQISTPLKGLAVIAGEVAMGNLAKRANEAIPGEIGQLAQAFNRMTEKLQVLYGTLENRIEERTRDLNSTNEQLQEEIVERTRIENNLLSANEELSVFKHFIEASSNAMAIVTLDWNISYGNPALCELLGIPVQALPRHSLKEFYSSEDLHELLEEVLPSVMAQGNWKGEFRIHDQMGGVRETLHELNLLRDVSGQPYAMANVIIDITERKRAEMLLIRHKAAIETVHEGFWIMNMQGALLEVNRAYANLVGYSVDELCTMNISQLEAREVSPNEIGKHIVKVIFQGYDVFETRHRHKDGHELEFEVSVTFVKESQTFIAFFRDITKRKQAESILRRHKVAIDTVHDGFWITDLQGNLIEVNQAYARMSGYTAKELQGMHISQLEAKEQSREVVEAHIARIISQGYDLFETRHRHKDGHEIDVEISTTCIPESQQLVVFSRDITERKQAGAALNNSKRQFDRLAANIPVGVYLLQTTPLGDAVFKYVSPRFCSILGVSEEAVYRDTRNSFHTIHPDDIEVFIRLNQSAVLLSEAFLWEGRIVVEAQLRWVRVESTPESQPNGDCMWDGLITDITENHLAHLELERNQVLLNEAQRLGHLGSWEHDLVNDQLRWSDEIYRLLEIDRTQLSPSYQNFLLVAHPEDRDMLNQAYAESMRNKQPFDVDHRLLMADGRIKWVREHGIHEFDQAGRLQRTVGAIQDITSQKLAEDRLRVEAATFETHEGILITDAEANILRVNHAFTEITGYSADEVLGKNPRMLSSGQQSKEFYVEMWRQLEGKGTWSGEIWDKRKNGEIYPKWLTISTVKDGKGRVTEYVASFSDITSRKRAEEEIRNLAFYDALTGLPNRRLLMDRLQLALALSARSNHCGAFLFLDMDKFKTLNDTLGHDYGDLMLVEVGRRIQACVREVDTVARLGGDEFVVLLEEISANLEETSQKVALIAEKIRFSLAEPYALNGHEFHSSPSIGVSLYRGNAESVDTLMKHADMAMYQAKDAGRNRVHFFDPLMQQAVEARAQLEADLRNALPNGQLQLYCQIQMDSENRPIGGEALIRWCHPQRGMVSPAQFIPVAEESGQILNIGQWVIESACRMLVDWSQEETMRHMVLAINVSAHQFRLSNFVERLSEIISRHGIDPERLKLELTESVVLEDVADVVGKMHALKALGVRLSLDDFGTGYSSLAYLKQLPLDQIKIDQSFVRDITTDPNDAVMVKAIIDMAQNFRLGVIAEGVETEAQLAFLKHNGCLAYQGYLFSKPIPVADFVALVRRLSI